MLILDEFKTTVNLFEGSLKGSDVENYHLYELLKFGIRG